MCGGPRTKSVLREVRPMTAEKRHARHNTEMATGIHCTSRDREESCPRFRHQRLLRADRGAGLHAELTRYCRCGDSEVLEDGLAGRHQLYTRATMSEDRQSSTLQTPQPIFPHRLSTPATLLPHRLSTACQFHGKPFAAPPQDFHLNAAKLRLDPITVERIKLCFRSPHTAVHSRSAPAVSRPFNFPA